MMAKKRILSTIFAVAMLAASAGQAMAQSNSDVASGSIDLTNASSTKAPFSNAAITPFSEDVGGGNWDYGTSYESVMTKKVWSNYYHPKKIHSSSCSIGTHHSNSGDTSAGTTSYSSTTGSSADTAKANWHAYTPPKS